MQLYQSEISAIQILIYESFFQGQEELSNLWIPYMLPNVLIINENKDPAATLVNQIKSM